MDNMEEVSNGPALENVEEVEEVEVERAVEVVELPINVLTVPPGIHHPSLAPIVSGGEPEACGFVSGTYFTAQLPSDFGNNYPFSRQFVTIGNIHPDMAVKIPIGRMNLDLAEIMFDVDVVNVRRRAMPMRFVRTVTGSLKGVIRTARRFTLDLERAIGPIEVLASMIKEQRVDLVVEPAYAAAFAETMDDSALRARRSLAQAFNDANINLTDVAHVSRHGRALLERRAEVSRFTMRLAALVVETAFGARDNRDTVTIDVPQAAQVYLVNGWTDFRRRIAEDSEAMEERNYVPWHELEGQMLIADSNIASLLRIATASNIAIELDQQHRDPLIWPEINNAILVTSVALPAGIQGVAARQQVYPSEMYQAAQMWSIRYGNIDLLEEYIQFYANIYWKHVEDNYALIPGFPNPAMEMPIADMKGFLLSPYLKIPTGLSQLMGKLKRLEVARLMSESIAAGILLNYATNIIKWQQIGYAMEHEVLDVDNFMSRMNLMRMGNDGVPLWNMTQALITKLGYRGSIGTLVGDLVCSTPSDQYWNLENGRPRDLHCSSTVGAFLPKLEEGCGLQGWIAPVPLPETFAKSNQVYHFGDLPAGTHRKYVCSLFEVAGIEWIQTVQSRQTAQVTSVMGHIPETGINNVALDSQYMAITLEDGSRSRWGYRVPVQATFTLHDASHDRYNLRWQYHDLNLQRPTNQQLEVKTMSGVHIDPPIPYVAFRPARDFAAPAPIPQALAAAPNRREFQRRIRRNAAEIHRPVRQAAPPPLRDNDRVLVGGILMDRKQARVGGSSVVEAQERMQQQAAQPRLEYPQMPEVARSATDGMRNVATQAARRPARGSQTMRRRMPKPAIEPPKYNNRVLAGPLQQREAPIMRGDADVSGVVNAYRSQIEQRVSPAVSIVSSRDSGGNTRPGRSAQEKLYAAYWLEHRPDLLRLVSPSGYPRIRGIRKITDLINSVIDANCDGFGQLDNSIAPTYYAMYITPRFIANDALPADIKAMRNRFYCGYGDMNSKWPVFNDWPFGILLGVEAFDVAQRTKQVCTYSLGEADESEALFARLTTIVCYRLSRECINSGDFRVSPKSRDFLELTNKFCILMLSKDKANRVVEILALSRIVRLRLSGFTGIVERIMVHPVDSNHTLWRIDNLTESEHYILITVLEARVIESFVGLMDLMPGVVDEIDQLFHGPREENGNEEQGGTAGGGEENNNVSAQADDTMSEVLSVVDDTIEMERAIQVDAEKLRLQTQQRRTQESSNEPAEEQAPEGIVLRSSKVLKPPTTDEREKAFMQYRESQPSTSTARQLADVFKDEVVEDVEEDATNPNTVNDPQADEIDTLAERLETAWSDTGSGTNNGNAGANQKSGGSNIHQVHYCFVKPINPKMAALTADLCDLGKYSNEPTPEHDNEEKVNRNARRRQNRRQRNQVQESEFWEKKEYRKKLIQLGVGEQDWEGVMVECLRLLAEEPGWKVRSDLYQCLDNALMQQRPGWEKWNTDDAHASPIAPEMQANRRNVSKGVLTDAEREQLLSEYDIMAHKTMGIFKWHKQCYTDHEKKVLERTIEMYFSQGCPSNMYKLISEAATILNVHLDAEAGIILLLEASTIEKEVEEARDKQLKAIEAFNRISKTTNKVVVKMDNLPISKSECLMAGPCNKYKTWCSTGNASLTWKEWHAFMLVGACPMVMENTFGGKWPRRVGRGDCNERVHTPYAHELWLKTLSEVQKAQYLLIMAPSVVGPEHYRALKDQITVDIVPKGTETTMNLEQRCRRKEKIEAMMSEHDHSGDGWAELLGQYFLSEYGELATRKSNIPRRETPGGMPITYTIEMVLNACPGALPMVEYLHNISPESDESEVCGTTIAICSLPKVVVEELLCSMIFDFPLNEWWKLFSESLTLIRRSLILGDLNGPELLHLRKIGNVTIRCLDRPDMSTEDWNRSMIVTRKSLLNAIGEAWPISSFYAYEQQFIKSFELILNNTLLEAPADMKFGTISDFWSERAIRGANGASKMIKKYKISEMVPEMHDSDRPGKKVLVELLHDDTLFDIMRWQPQQRAYYFLKPEPGHKQRALYATYDEESFVSAYANAGIENHMSKHKGVFVRQTPADVIEWMSVSHGGLAGAEGHGKYWVSTDYSDYNSEHTLWEMSALDLGFATYYEKARITSSTSITGCREKRIAHLWNLIAKQKSVIIYSDSAELISSEGREYLPFYFDNYMEQGVAQKRPKRILRVSNGLFSGSRTTARDNTWIHAVDMIIGETTLKNIGMGGYENINWSAVCGDDEDAAFASMTSAILYTSSLSAVGHVINPMKQTAGMEYHEFLQFVFSRETRIEKSMNTLLATLATGNWYVQKGVWLQSSISAVFSNYWELYLRGMPLQMARRLAATTLDRLMQVKTDDSVSKPLEWWRYRFAKGLPPLYHYNGDPVIGMPRYEHMVEPTESWPRAATVAYTTKHKKLLNNLPSRIHDEMEDICLGASVGAAIKVRQQKGAKMWASKYWPVRETEDVISIINSCADWRRSAKDQVDLNHIRYGIPRKNEMLTEEDVAGRMGVPFFIARRLGGTEALGKYVKPEQWAKYVPTNDIFIPLNGNGYELQTNLRAAVSWSNTPIVPFQGRERDPKPSKVLYVYMGNGAGKTHLSRINSNYQDIDKVWMDVHGSIRQKADAAWNRSCMEPFSRVMQELLRKAWKRSSILLGQVDPSIIIQAGKMCGMGIEVCSYDPGESVRYERLTRRSDWDESRIIRRIKRSNLGYLEAAKLGVVFDNQGALIQHMNNFMAECKNELETMEVDGKRIPAKFVYDFSGPLSRRLEIEMEN